MAALRVVLVMRSELTGPEELISRTATLEGPKRELT